MMCNCFVAINFPASTVVYVDDFLDDVFYSIAVWSLFRMYFVVRVSTHRVFFSLSTSDAFLFVTKQIIV